MKFLSALALIIAFSCGDQAGDQRKAKTKDPRQTQLEILQKQVLQLTGTLTELNNMVLSDFATCDSTGGSDAEDPLINKICKVAQASTVEAKVEMKEELRSFSNALESQLQYVEEDLSTILGQLEDANFATIAADLAQLQTDVVTINGTPTTLDTRVTNAETAIAALESLTSSISGTLNGTVEEV